MDNITILARDYNDIMSDNIYMFAIKNSGLPRHEFDKLMYRHLNNWKAHLLNIINDDYANPIMKQVADINLYDIDSRLRIIHNRIA